MMCSTKISAVLFDWDLTLARVLGDVSESQRLQALFRWEGLVYRVDEIEAAMNKVRDNAHSKKVEPQTRPQTRRDIINSYFKILKNMGYRERNWELGNRLYDAHGFLPTYLYDDSLPTLLYLHQKGFTLGIISNHSHSARELIEQKVSHLIPPDHIIISQEVRVHKPAKTIFRLATSSIGESAANCIFVGNNLEVDAIGAVEQGGFSLGLWLDRDGIGEDRPLPGQVFRITSLSQVLDYV